MQICNSDWWQKKFSNSRDFYNPLFLDAQQSKDVKLPFKILTVRGNFANTA